MAPHIMPYAYVKNKAWTIFSIPTPFLRQCGKGVLNILDGVIGAKVIWVKP